MMKTSPELLEFYENNSNVFLEWFKGDSNALYSLEYFHQSNSKDDQIIQREDLPIDSNKENIIKSEMSDVINNKSIYLTENLIEATNDCKTNLIKTD